MLAGRVAVPVPAQRQVQEDVVVLLELGLVVVEGRGGDECRRPAGTPCCSAVHSTS